MAEYGFKRLLNETSEVLEENPAPNPSSSQQQLGQKPLDPQADRLELDMMCDNIKAMQHSFNQLMNMMIATQAAIGNTPPVARSTTASVSSATPPPMDPTNFPHRLTQINNFLPHHSPLTQINIFILHHFHLATLTSNPHHTSPPLSPIPFEETSPNTHNFLA
ncbi:hypothetical protein PCASD_18814 [Puccinia coronata f. sp. avenae]|uniref:Uncharacterized protein n=1 Tax=Puccinia coronata f. sp. avenae TaxID=200324 RepID=A0A2N5T9I6_9BASI|nr:hypothetical protein PCASD_18814 [Puccinia coronata f. sp. avenae]